MTVEYIPLIVQYHGLHPDNGQGLASSDACMYWGCQTWVGNVAHAPKLVRNDKGFLVCPNCHRSYGGCLN